AGNVIAITTVNGGGIFVGELNSSGGNRGAGGAGSSSGAFGSFGQPAAVTVRTTTGFANPGAPVTIGFIQAVSDINNLATINAAAGVITLSGSSVAAVSGGLTVGATNYSIYGGSSQTITAAGASIPSNYSANGDLSSLTTAAITISTSPFLAVNAGIDSF